MTEPSFRFFASSAAVSASLIGLGVLAFQPDALERFLTAIVAWGVLAFVPWVLLMVVGLGLFCRELPLEWVALRDRSFRPSETKGLLMSWASSFPLATVVLLHVGVLTPGSAGFVAVVTTSVVGGLGLWGAGFLVGCVASIVVSILRFAMRPSFG